MDGAVARIAETSIRENGSVGDPTEGRGISAKIGDYGNNTSVPSDLSVHTSVIEKNTGIGIFVGGSAAHIEGTIVRETKLDSSGLGEGVFRYKAISPREP